MPWRHRGGVEVQLCSFFNLDARCWWMVTVTSPLLYLRKKTRCPFYERMGEPQGLSGHVRKISPPSGSNPRTARYVASRYTGWAIRLPLIANRLFCSPDFADNLWELPIIFLSSAEETDYSFTQRMIYNLYLSDANQIEYYWQLIV